MLSSMTVQAGVMYRWVDKNGVLNYSQVEPQGVKSEKIITRGTISSRVQEDTKSAPAQTAEATKPRLTEEQQRKLDELKALHAQEQQQVAEIKRTNCEKSKSVLERLKQSERIRVREATGTERIIGEDERQRRIEEAQQGIASNCT
jgi:Domain of unknown function (DUF4124)